MVRAADGFQYPVGPNGTAEGYYIARGYRPNGHLGEDWNGVRGGDTDLGDPVYAAANGFVMFARNYHVGWGNVVILRHAYYEGSTLKYCDSLYGHLLDFTVQEGQQVRRGQQIGRIGNNFGMYEAHLHFEMRKNLQIGMFRSSFLRDFSNYYTPNEFIAAHRTCPNGNHMVNIPINTYPPVAPPVIAGPHVESPVFSVPAAGAPSQFAKISPLRPAGTGPALPLPPAVKVITRISTPTPAPTTPEPKVAKSKVLAVAPPPTPTPAPDPTIKTFRTGTSICVRGLRIRHPTAIGQAQQGYTHPSPPRTHHQNHHGFDQSDNSNTIGQAVQVHRLGCDVHPRRQIDEEILLRHLRGGGRTHSGTVGKNQQDHRFRLDPGSSKERRSDSRRRGRRFQNHPHPPLRSPRTRLARARPPAQHRSRRSPPKAIWRPSPRTRCFPPPRQRTRPSSAPARPIKWIDSKTCGRPAISGTKTEPQPVLPAHSAR